MRKLRQRGNPLIVGYALGNMVGGGVLFFVAIAIGLNLLAVTLLALAAVLGWAVWNQETR